MPGRFFTFASTLSLLVCLATLSLWVRSFWVADVLCDVDVAIISYRGEFVWVNMDTSSSWHRGWPRHTSPKFDEIAEYLAVVDGASQWTRDRQWSSIRIRTGQTMTSLGRGGRLLGLSPTQIINVRLLMVAILFAVMALAALLTAIYKKHAWARRHRFCHRCLCLYSLVGNPSGLCPMCGRAQSFFLRDPIKTNPPGNSL